MMRLLCRALVWTLTIFCLCRVTPALASPDKIALVIGNAEYRYAPALKNPANDALDMSRTMKELGFDVVDGINLDRQSMERAIRDFGGKLTTAKIAVFFYAGHGMQVAGRNYLLPIDAQLARLSELTLDTIDLQTVLQQMEGTQRVNLVFLDACRDNPMAKALAANSGSRSTSVGSGLASVQGAVGTMISFATQPDAVAFDGEGRNSPFTTALLKHIKAPGTDVAVVMRRVRSDVLAATGNSQVPWDHSSLTDSVVLAGVPGIPAQIPASPTSPKPVVGTFSDAGPTSVLLTTAAEKALKAGDSFKECPECPEMVVIPAGVFRMGASASDVEKGYGYKDETPQREVRIENPFAAGKFEITFAEWDACVNGGGCGGYRPLDQNSGRGRTPVFNVSWKDAKLYVKWLAERTGKPYRLLSEAEWEYAARSGASTVYHFGNDARALCTYANVADEAASLKDKVDDGIGRWLPCNDGFKGVAPVGRFKPNAYGLHDMLGNVVEWVEDVWNPDYKGAPKNQLPWTSGPDQNVRIGRGGSFRHLGDGNRVTSRYNYSGAGQGNLVGFRIARSLN